MTTPTNWHPDWAQVEQAIQQGYREAVAAYITRWFRRRGVPLPTEGVDLGVLGRRWGVTFVTQKLPYLHKLEQQLMQRFTKTAIFRAFREAAELGTQPVTALVFSWPKYGKFFVLHDLQSWPECAKTGRFWRLGSNQRLVWLQPLAEFLEELYGLAKTTEETEILSE